MSLPILLAHGGLGSWDELIFLGVVVIFIVMMGVAWVRSRATQLDDHVETGSEEATSAGENETTDHFQLD